MLAFDLAWHDLKRSFRGAFAPVFMFVLPIMTAGLIYFAFSGLMSEESPQLPIIPVQVVNLDQGAAGMDFAAGEMLVGFLQDESLADLIQLTQSPNEAAARAAVDAQEAAVAVILPADLTRGIVESEAEATVTLYQDPTLSIGPGIVRDLIRQFLDGFSSTSILTQVTADQLSAAGVQPSPQLLQQAAMGQVAYLESLGEAQGIGGLEIIPVKAGQQPNAMTQLITPIMAGMMVFYCFFTGASTAESILRDDEEGTLSRLFTTPLRRATILGGKYLSVFVHLIVQVTVLLIASALIFGIRWPAAPLLILAVVGLVVAAAGFGVFIISFLTSSKQAGFVMGGVLTITGMFGGVMMQLPPSFDIVTRFVPQGWAMGLWEAALAGSLSEMWLPWAVSMGLGLAFFLVGVLMFRRRFA